MTEKRKEFGIKRRHPGYSLLSCQTLYKHKDAPYIITRILRRICDSRNHRENCYLALQTQFSSFHVSYNKSILKAFFA